MPDPTKPYIADAPSYDELARDMDRADMSSGEKVRRAFGVAGMNIAHMPGAIAQLGALASVAGPFATMQDLNDLNTKTGNAWAYGMSSLDAAGELFDIDPDSITPEEDVLGAIISAPLFVGGVTAATGSKIAANAPLVAKASAVEGGIDALITDASRGFADLDYITPAGIVGKAGRDKVEAILDEQEEQGQIKLEMPKPGEKLELSLAGASGIDADQFFAEVDAIQGQAELAEESGGDPYADTPWETEDKILIGGAAALAALGSAAAIRSIAKSTPRSRGVDFGANPESELQSATSVAETSAANMLDPNEAIASQITKAAGREAGEDFLSLAAKNTRLGAATRSLHANDAGELPNSAIHIESLRKLEEDFAALPDEVQRVFSEGMFAADELDQRYISRYHGTGDNTVSHTRPSAPTYSDQQLQDRMNLLLKDPRMMELKARYRDTTEKLLKYSRQQGFLDDTNFQYLSSMRHNYVPRIKDPFNGEKSGFKQRMISLKEAYNHMLGRDSVEARVLRDTEHLIQRNMEQGMGLSRTMNPVAALEYYTTGITLAAQKNKAKLRAIDTLAGSPLYERSLRRVAVGKDARKSNYPPPRNEDAVVSVFRDGRREWWEFADPMMAGAVGFRPHEIPGAITGIFAAMRRQFQMGTTGILQPFFATKSLLWDANVSAIFRKPGYSMGLIDGWLQRHKPYGYAMGLPGDPTAYISALLGVGRDVAAKLERQIVVGIERSLTHSAPSLWKAFPEQSRKMIARKLWTQYIKSTRAMMLREGVHNTGFMVDPATSVNSLLAKTTPLFSGQTNMIGVKQLQQLVSGYAGLIDSMHNGSRVAFYAQNYRPDMTPKELDRLALETRQLTGDFSASGASPTYRAITEAMPYSNVTVQATRRMADSALASIRQKDPTIVVGLIMGTSPFVAGAVLASYFGGEYWDYYWNKMPAWERSTHTYLPIPGLPPEEGMMIPIAPEVQVPGQLALAAVDGFLNLSGSTGLAEGKTAENHDLLEASLQYLGIIMPPAVNAGLAMTGNKLDTGAVWTEGESVLRPIRKNALAGWEEDTRVPGSDIGASTSEALTAIFGTTIGFFIEGFQTGEQGVEQELRPTEIVDQIGANFKQQAKRRTPVGRPIWGGNSLSVMNDANRELSRKLDVLNKFERQYKVEQFGSPAAQTRPVTDPDANLPPKGTNPEYRDSLNLMFGLMRSPEMRELISHRKYLKNTMDGISANLVMDPKVRQDKINSLVTEYQDLTDTLLHKVRETERVGGFKLEDLEPFE